jgi:hypothetical protein
MQMKKEISVEKKKYWRAEWYKPFQWIKNKNKEGLAKKIKGITEENEDSPHPFKEQKIK